MWTSGQPLIPDEMKESARTDPMARDDVWEIAQPRLMVTASSWFLRKREWEELGSFCREPRFGIGALRIVGMPVDTCQSCLHSTTLKLGRVG